MICVTVNRMKSNLTSATNREDDKRIYIQCDAIRWEPFFAEMSSWTALTRYLGMKATFKVYKSKYVCIIIMMILIVYKIIRKCILTQQ